MLVLYHGVFGLERSIPSFRNLLYLFLFFLQLALPFCLSLFSFRLRRLLSPQYLGLLTVHVTLKIRLEAVWVSHDLRLSTRLAFLGYRFTQHRGQVYPNEIGRVQLSRWLGPCLLRVSRLDVGRRFGEIRLAFALFDTIHCLG